MSSPGKSNARRFLDAFNRIEQALASRGPGGLGAEPRLTFAQLVKRSKDLHPRQRDRLLEYAQLRNVIVHQPYDEHDEPYADPRRSTVRWIEDQADVVERPPLVRTVLQLQPPRVLAEGDDVTAFLRLVGLPSNFSQAPVVTGTEMQLITTNAVARWIAASYEVGSGVAVEAAPIAHILTFAETGDRLVARPATLKVVEALRVFSGEIGEPPAAILLTQSGKLSEKPMGLCVKADIPDLLQSLKI